MMNGNKQQKQRKENSIIENISLLMWKVETLKTIQLKFHSSSKDLLTYFQLQFSINFFVFLVEHGAHGNL